MSWELNRINNLCELISETRSNNPNPVLSISSLPFSHGRTKLYLSQENLNVNGSINTT